MVSWWVWTWAAADPCRPPVSVGQQGDLRPWDVSRICPILRYAVKRINAAGTYGLMKERGELVQFGQNLVDVSAFLSEIRERLDGQQVLCILTDRYRKSEFSEYAQKSRLNWPVIWRGQGPGRKADGSYDVRAVGFLCEAGAIKHQRSLLVEHALAGSELRRDELRNPALARSDRNSRLDVLSAMTWFAAAFANSRPFRSQAGISWRGKCIIVYKWTPSSLNL